MNDEKSIASEKNTTLSNFQTMEEIKREHFYKAMKLAGGNKAQVAKMLDMTVKSIYNIVDKYYSESLKNIESNVTEGE